MRVVASAWLLAQAATQPLRVLWYRTPDFNARFDTLFNTERLPFTVTERAAPHRAQRALWRVREAVARFAGLVVIGPRDTVPGQFDADAMTRRLRGRSTLIRSNSRLKYQPGMYEIFRPAVPMAMLVDRLRPRLAASVGVHVRRTDNSRATAVSTLQCFVSLMRAELLVDPTVQFFVATDSTEAWSVLCDTFGEKVWEHPKRTYARDNPCALTDAVVDLYALGQCRKLIGSFWSSFTDTAAELRGIECIVAGASP